MKHKKKQQEWEAAFTHANCTVQRKNEDGRITQQVHWNRDEGLEWAGNPLWLCGNLPFQSFPVRVGAAKRRPEEMKPGLWKKLSFNHLHVSMCVSAVKYLDLISPLFPHCIWVCGEHQTWLQDLNNQQTHCAFPIKSDFTVTARQCALGCPAAAHSLDPDFHYRPIFSNFETIHDVLHSENIHIL